MKPCTVCDALGKLCDCAGSASRLVMELESGVGCRMGQAVRKLRQGVTHWWSSQRSGVLAVRGGCLGLGFWTQEWLCFASGSGTWTTV